MHWMLEISHGFREDQACSKPLPRGMTVTMICSFRCTQGFLARASRKSGPLTTRQSTRGSFRSKITPVGAHRRKRTPVSRNRYRLSFRTRRQRVSGLSWVLRHLPAYLIRGEELYSMLLKHLDSFREVRFRIGHGLGDAGPLENAVCFPNCEAGCDDRHSSTEKDGRHNGQGGCDSTDKADIAVAAEGDMTALAVHHPPPPDHRRDAGGADLTPYRRLCSAVCQGVDLVQGSADDLRR